MHTETTRSCKRWCVPTCSNTPYDWGFVKIAHFRNPTHNLGYFQIWHEKWWSPVSEICKREHQLKSSSIKINQGPACSQGETWSPSQNPPVRKAHHQIMKSFESNLLNVVGRNNRCIHPTLEGWVYIIPIHRPLDEPLNTWAQYAPTLMSCSEEWILFMLPKP